MDINNTTLLSMLVQGKNLSMPSINGGILLCLKLFLVNQTGLIKQSRWKVTISLLNKCSILSDYV